MEILFVMCPVIYIAIVMDAFIFLIKGKRDMVLSSPLWAMLSLVIIILLLGLDEMSPNNDCCGNWSLLSPEHRISIYALIALCTVVYFYCELRAKLAPPVVEVIVNCLLLSGIALIVFMSIQEGTGVGLFILIPQLLLLIMRLTANHRQFMKETELREAAFVHRNWAARVSWRLLRLPVAAKFPALLLICCPLLAILSSVLLLFGPAVDQVARRG